MQLVKELLLILYCVVMVLKKVFIHMCMHNNLLVLEGKEFSCHKKLEEHFLPKKGREIVFNGDSKNFTLVRAI